MTDTKMLQILINGQVELKKQMAEGFEKVDEDFKRVDESLKKVITQIGSLGKSVGYLEDDATTIEEYLKLEKCVTN